MTPFNIHGKTIYINDITKILFMSDAEFDEEYRDLLACDIGEDVNDPFTPLPSAPPLENEDVNEDARGRFDDFEEFEDLIRQKMS